MLTIYINCFTLLLNKMQEENLKMSKFVIKSEILERFSKLSTIRLEVKNSRQYIIGYNKYIACLQYLGECADSDEVIYIGFNETSLENLRFELSIGSDYIIETNPELALATVTTSLGSKYDNFVYWLDEDETDNWPSWFTESNETVGFMYWDLYQVQTLFECSPSGEIIFPEHINATKPVIVVDANNTEWLGVFIPRSDSDKPLKPAILPEWMK